MSKRRTRPYIPEPFEGTPSQPGTKRETFLMLASSMQHSPAWKDLGPGAKVLYIACKDQFYRESPHPIRDNERSFTMNQAKWASEYELYTKENWRGFRRDMEALILHGFVRCLDCGAFAHRKTIYELSGEWQNWGKPCFSITNGDITEAMKRAAKRRKAPGKPEKQPPHPTEE